MSSKQVVLAVYPNEAAAEGAVEGVKAWDKASDDIKLNAMGVLVLDDEGQVKTEKMGSRSVGKGAGIGLVLAFVSPITAVGGMIGGGALGALHHKGLGMSREDRDRLAGQLGDGKAAVGVLAGDDAEAGMIAAKLVELGGSVEVHEVAEEALEEAHQADVATPAG